jgi:hypothetical protein
MPFVRRRPLLRAAVVGGGAYMAGKRTAQRQADQQEQAAGASQAAGPQQTREQAPAPAVPAQPGPSMTEQLKQLAELHGQGVLSDVEFANAKAKLLGD